MSRARRNLINRTIRPAPVQQPQVAQPAPQQVQAATTPPAPRELISQAAMDRLNQRGESTTGYAVVGQPQPQPVAQPQPATPKITPAQGGCDCSNRGIGKAITADFVPRAFCHEENTMVIMEDGSLKRIRNIKVGDRVLHGGEVLGKANTYSTEDMYEYRGEIMTASHQIKENGVWIAVTESHLAKRREDMDGVIICPLELENNIYETQAGYKSADISFEMVNKKAI